MSSQMAFAAERDTVARLISKVGVWTPGFDMVNFKPASPLSAILAGIVVAAQGVYPKFFVLSFAKVLVSYCRMTALPVGVRRANKMIVSWWLAASAPTASTDSLFMFLGQGFTRQGFTNGFVGLFPGFWRHHFGLILTLSGYFRKFISDSWALYGIVSQIRPSSTARERAKLLTVSFVILAALITISFIE